MTETSTKIYSHPFAQLTLLISMPLYETAV